MSIHNRLIAGLFLGLLLVFAVSGNLLYFYMRTVLTRQFDAALTAKAHAISSLIKQQPDGGVELDFSADAMPEFGPSGRSDYFQVWREDGSVLGRSPSLDEHDLLRDTDGSDSPLFKDFVLTDGRTGRSIELAVVPVADEDERDNGGRPPGRTVPARSSTVLVVVAQDRSDLDRTMTLLLSALLGVAGLVGIGAVAIVTLTVRAGLRPLEQVAEHAAGIDAGSLNVRFPTDGLPNELTPICQRLNECLERLEAAFKRERRFTADVAHELRTPIAELRTLADVALKWQGDPETSAACFKDAQEIAQQMERIVSTLLALARCQSGSMVALRENIVLSEVVQEAWNCHKDRAVRRGLVVTFDIPRSLVLESDHTMLLSTVVNLLSNAVEYTPHGGLIECRAERSGPEARLTVSNGTDSLEPDDLPHVFEPFWRKDSARTDSSHSGLGLTLVAAYAGILGGRVEATVRDRTLRLTLALPCNSQARSETFPCPIGYPGRHIGYHWSGKVAAGPETDPER